MNFSAKISLKHAMILALPKMDEELLVWHFSNEVLEGGTDETHSGRNEWR